MKVILLSDIKGVGKKDQVIEASDGYARNYLFPKNLAVEANNTNMSKLKAKQESNQFRKDTEKKEAEEIAKKLKGIMLKIKVKAGNIGYIGDKNSATYQQLIDAGLQDGRDFD